MNEVAARVDRTQSVGNAEAGGAATARPPALMGLARLMSMAFEGADLGPLAVELIARASADESDADALMDLSIVLQLQGHRDLGLATQALALQARRLYELPSAGVTAIRLLAIMAAGDLMTNTPLPFLVEGSDIALSMLYVLPGETIPIDLPAHDVVFIAVSEADSTRALLAALAGAVPMWTKPVVNAPERIARTSRAQAHTLLAGAPGICMPVSARATRERLQRLSSGGLDLPDMLCDGAFPLIVRPVGSHAGRELQKVDCAHELRPYLEATAAAEFFISRFVDYRGNDGLFRKYRVVLIDGIPYAGHMGISTHWMIHYLNAGMFESAAKRAEEEAFMRTFEVDFARRHDGALQAISERVGLDYLVIDCAETAAGELLIFEIDGGAVVHSMDPAGLFPYKRPQMGKLFAAFRAMLVRAITIGRFV
ncbi:MAG: ATP-grasp domain-containing protein [Caldimonas sp.]